MGMGFLDHGPAAGCLRRGELEEVEGAFLVGTGLAIAFEGGQL